jgi:hypothetical protein
LNPRQGTNVRAPVESPGWPMNTVISRDEGMLEVFMEEAWGLPVHV